MGEKLTGEFRGNIGKRRLTKLFINCMLQRLAQGFCLDGAGQ
jgi:hypothetical protein